MGSDTEKIGAPLKSKDLNLLCYTNLKHFAGREKFKSISQKGSSG